MKKDIKSNFRLNLRERTCVFVDWANVYGWSSSLHKEVDLKKLRKYLLSYKQVKEIYLYFGTDTNEASRNFIKTSRNLGLKTVTKPVKYVQVATVNNQKIYRRKCDFDMEISIDVHRLLEKDVESFVFFTGDGDFEPLYKLLLNRKKQVIVIFADGHLGREIVGLGEVFKKAVNKLGVDVFK